MDQKILIKKYENRRLYDVTHSRYVNLDEIARAVQDGTDVLVVDATSGEDITRFVLTQIITEFAKAPGSVFPLDILRQMIVASGKAGQESALTYMRAVADLYKNALRGFSSSMSPFDIMQNMIGVAPHPQAEGAGSSDPRAAFASTPQLLPPNQQPQENVEILYLRHRIQELEATVHNLSAQASSHPASEQPNPEQQAPEQPAPKKSTRKRAGS
jgi:polyhydroxyalkanoate synthesis repressor PhaR